MVCDCEVPGTAEGEGVHSSPTFTLQSNHDSDPH
jgi:hypothetical protein